MLARLHAQGAPALARALSSSAQEVDVAIVGGGMVGMSLAAALSATPVAC